MGGDLVEEVPCSCGRGVIPVKVTVWRIGVLAFRVETAAKCASCGSHDLPAARAAAKTPDHAPSRS